MKLNDDQIHYIHSDIEQRGITVPTISASLLDHLCCAVEADEVRDFHSAYENALAAFGDDGLLEVQEEVISIINHKKLISMKKTMYVLGFIAAFLSTTGLLFKLMHWPGASIMLILGVALLNVGFFPLYFYDRYKTATN